MGADKIWSVGLAIESKWRCAKLVGEMIVDCLLNLVELASEVVDTFDNRLLHGCPQLVLLLVLFHIKFI